MYLDFCLFFANFFLKYQDWCEEKFFFYEEFKISVLYKILLTLSRGVRDIQHPEFIWET